MNNVSRETMDSYEYSSLLFDMIIDNLGDISLDYFKAASTDDNIAILEYIAQCNGLPYGNNAEDISEIRGLLRWNTEWKIIF